MDSTDDSHYDKSTLEAAPPPGFKDALSKDARFDDGLWEEAVR